MKKKKKNRGWLWILLAVILAGLGYYLYTQKDQKPKKRMAVEKPAPAGKTAPKPEQKVLVEKEKSYRVRPIKEEPPEKPSTKEDICGKLEKNVAEFFRYLDGKEYIGRLGLKSDTYAVFKKIIKRLSARPPVPAGEGVDPKILIRNVYHFFRVLERRDLRFIRVVMANERDTMEDNLDMFYRWLTLGDRCPDPDKLRPSGAVTYQYAGFFLNSTGGRAYLFRRSAGLRLLVTYYCLLIVHKADREGRNNYGIDTFGFVAPLKEEIGHNPDLQYQHEYLEQLKWVESYYLQKRK